MMKNKKQKNTMQPMEIQKSTDFIYQYGPGISPWLYIDQDGKLIIVATDDFEKMCKIAALKYWTFIAAIQIKDSKKINYDILIPRFKDESEEEHTNKVNDFKDYLRHYSSGVSLKYILSGKTEVDIDLQ